MKSCIWEDYFNHRNVFSLIDWLVHKLILSCFVGGHIHHTALNITQCFALDIAGQDCFIIICMIQKCLFAKIVPRILQQNVRLHVYKVRGHRHILYLVDEISCQLSAKPHQILQALAHWHMVSSDFRTIWHPNVHAVSLGKMQILVFFLHCVSSPQSHSKHDCRETRFCLFSCVWNRMRYDRNLDRVWCKIYYYQADPQIR